MGSITHTKVTGAPADPTAIVDGPAWDAAHTFSLTPSDVGLGNVPNVDATNAGNIAGGTLPAARLPNPTASTLGGVESIAATSHNWINSISTSGVPSLSQPTFSDLGTGTAPAFTLGGTISGGGNQINDVIIGNASPHPGGFTNLFVSGTASFGTNSNFPSGTIFGISGNVGATIPVMAGFVPQAVIVGADNTRGELAIQSYATLGGESTLLLFSARGTMAAPTHSVSGDFTGEMFSHPFDGTNFVHNAGAGFIYVTTEDTSPTNAGHRIDVWTTPTGTATAAQAASFQASGGFSVGTASDPGVGIINALNGYRINNAAATVGHVLRANGTNYVDAQLAFSDLSVANNSVTRAMEAQGVARSVIGVTGNATANVADIQGAANTFLGVNSAGTVLAFTSVPNAALANSSTTIAGQTATLGGTAGLSSVKNTLGGDVNLNNTGLFFDGPSCAQGTTGTWLATGQVMCLDTAGAALFTAKLWDGTTVMGEGQAVSNGANASVVISLSGSITSPAANIRISVNDGSSTSGKIKFAVSQGSSSTLTVVRIA